MAVKKRTTGRKNRILQVLGNRHTKRRGGRPGKGREARVKMIMGRSTKIKKQERVRV